MIDAIITLWKLFSAVENQPGSLGNFDAGPSRKILILLTITVLENEQVDIWRDMCSSCVTLMWDILAKLLTFTSKLYLIQQN